MAKVRTIWRNDDYEELKENCIKYENYCEDCSFSIDDERANLDIEVDGYIVAFADLGLWDGRHQGAGIVGNNVKDILSSDCDYVHWYCDRYNVKCDATHHDGTNHYIYRVAKDKDTARQLANDIAYQGMTLEQFYKKTKSLRPYVARTYGW